MTLTNLPVDGQDANTWGPKVIAALEQLDATDTAHVSAGHPLIHPVLVGGKVPASQLPTSTTTTNTVVANQAAMLALPGNVGDLAVRSDQSNQIYILIATPASTLGNWLATGLQAAITSVNGKTGASVTLAAADVGAAESSHSHPHTHIIADVSTLQTAIDGKAAVGAVKSSSRSRKGADQSVTSNSLVTLTGLSFTMGASEEWDFELTAIYEASTTADLKISITAPAGATLGATWLQSYGTGVAGGSYNATNKYEPFTALATPVVAGGLGLGFPTPLLIRGTIINGTTAGDVGFQWAQSVTDAANAATIKAGSVLVAVKA